jgi:hypothetical protein
MKNEKKDFKDSKTTYDLKKLQMIGVFTIPVAKVIRKRVYYYTVIFYGIKANKVKLFSYLIRVNAEKAKINKLKEIENKIKSQVVSGRLASKVRANLDSIVASLSKSGSCKVANLSDDHLKAILGSPRYESRSNGNVK